MEQASITPLTNEEKDVLRAKLRALRLQPGPPVITIFVRHSSDCKYAGDEFCKRCDCRKHFRWSSGGTQYRRKAGTRSWAEAEEKKRELEDQLAGRTSAPKPEQDTRDIRGCVDSFLQDKRNQGITEKVIGKYTRELARLRTFCEEKNVFTVQGITRELLTAFCATWLDMYPSSTTRSKVRERVRSFLRYAYDCQWIPRIPPLPKIKIDEPPTMPLAAAEYTRLLDAVYGTVADPEQRAKVHALFQLMRYSGLAIRDALTLKREEIQFDKAKQLHRIVTARQKTGVHVSVPIPPDVAQELLTVLNGNAEYVFWSGKGEEESITKNWAKYYIAPCFKAAKIPNDGHMMSHRLRDTFAVDLLEKGVPLEEVSKLLGHESIKTTERSYAKWVKGRQDRLDALVTAAWESRKQK
jgi:site-specific recombinase XerD